MTVYWVVWDAAAHWIVDRLVAEERLPGVARLRDAGIRAAARPPAPNCQTPPALATLFTGEWPGTHHVTGFMMPTPAGAADAAMSGFTPGVCAAPPVWEHAAAAGLRTVSVHAPWVFDRDHRVLGGVDAAIDGYGRQLAMSGARRVSGAGTLEIGSFTVGFTPDDDGIQIGCCGARMHIEPAQGWRELRLGRGIGLWLRAALIRGQLVLLHTGAWHVRVGGHDTALVDELDRMPVFVGQGLGSLYRAGRLGPRLIDGGNGSAEELFLSSLDCVPVGFRAATESVLARRRADLVVIYLPITDDVSHELIGWCDKESACYRADLADAAWRGVTRCYEAADALLARVLDQAEPEDTVVLSADHGIAGAAWQVLPNAALASAGLVSCTGQRIDLAGSAVMYHPANNGAVTVNHTGRPGGWVPPERISEVMRQAEEALRAIVEPGTGRPAVVDFRREDAAAGLATVVFAADFQPSAAFPADGRAVSPARRTGVHVSNTGDPRLHAVLVAAGPGLEPCVDVGTVDNTLPARLVLRQLGLSSPSADSERGALPGSAAATRLGE